MTSSVWQKIATLQVHAAEQRGDGVFAQHHGDGDEGCPDKHLMLRLINYDQILYLSQQ